MIRIDVRSNLGDVGKDLRRLAAHEIGQAQAMALNKVVDKARAEMTRAITAEFAIKAVDVRAQVRVTRRAKKGRPEVELMAFGRRRGHRSRNVMLFAAKQTRKGVTVRIKRGGPRKLIKGAFIANKGRTVFRRDGEQRLPISAVETIDVPQMFNTRRIAARVRAKILADLPVETSRAISLALARRVPTSA